MTTPCHVWSWIESWTRKRTGVEQWMTLEYGLQYMLVFLVLISVLWSCKILPFEEGGWRVTVNSLYYFCNIFVSLDLFQNVSEKGRSRQGTDLQNKSTESQNVQPLLPNCTAEAPSEVQVKFKRSRPNPVFAHQEPISLRTEETFRI